MMKKILISLLLSGLLLSTNSVYSQNKVVIIPMEFGPAASASGSLQNIITVSKENGDFTSVGAALSSIQDSSETNPYLVYIGPGIYDIPQPLSVPTYVDMIGSGEHMTKLVSKMSGSTSSMISILGKSKISDLSLEGNYTAEYPSPTLIETTFGSLFVGLILTNIDIVMGSDSALRKPTVIVLEGTDVELDNVTLNTNGIGLRFSNLSFAIVRDSFLYADTAIDFGFEASLDVYNSYIYGSYTNSSANQIAIHGAGTAGPDRVRVRGSVLRGAVAVKTQGAGSSNYMVSIMGSTIEGIGAFEGTDVDTFVCAATDDISGTLLNEDCSHPAP